MAFVHDLKRRFFIQRVDRVGADAEPFFHLPLDGFGGGEDGLEPQARHCFEGVQPLGREEPAGGNFHGAVGSPQGKQLFLEQNTRGEQREKLAVRLNIFQRGVGDVVFLRQPAEHLFLR